CRFMPWPTRGCVTREPARHPAGSCRRRPEGACHVSRVALAPASRHVGASSRAWRKFRRHRLAVVAAVLLALLALLAILAPVLAPHDPYDLAIGPDGQIAFTAPPGGVFLLGTDAIGRDVLSRLIYGGRVSLTIGLVAALVAISVGGALGVSAGHF